MLSGGLLVLVSSCTSHARPVESKDSPESFQVVSEKHEPSEASVPSWTGGHLLLARDGCLGECPVYQLIVTSEGRVSFSGKMFVEPVGRRTGTLPPLAFQEVASLAVQSGYFQTDHAYVPSITDSPGAYSSVAFDGRLHWVYDYAEGAPDEVQRIEGAIDGLMRWVEWDAEPEPAGTEASCLELGWSIMRRCNPWQRPEGAAMDCGFWYDVWRANRTPDCAVFVPLLRRIEPETGARADFDPLDTSCHAQLAKHRYGCTGSLLAGEIGSSACGRLHDASLDVNDALTDPDIAPENHILYANRRCMLWEDLP